MTHQINAALVLGAAFLLAAGACRAPEMEHHPEPDRPGDMPGAMGAMSMGEMMEHCREHGEAAMDSAERMDSMIEEALASEDPARMRSSLEETRRHLAAMRERMAQCMTMMEGMEHMHGDMMERMHGEMPMREGH
jgi:hypothetical protein